MVRVNIVRLNLILIENTVAIGIVLEKNLVVPEIKKGTGKGQVTLILKFLKSGI